MSKPFSQINRCLNRYKNRWLERFLCRFRTIRYLASPEQQARLPYC